MLSASSAFRWLRAAGAAGAPCKRGVAGRSGCCKTSSDAKVIFSAVKTKNPPTGSSGGGLIKSLLLRLLRFLGYPPARQTHVCIAVQQQVQTHTAFTDWVLIFTATRLHKPPVNHKARFPQRFPCARREHPCIAEISAPRSSPGRFRRDTREPSSQKSPG